MKLLQTWLQVNPKDKKEVVIIKHKIDNFGKDIFEQSVFERYSRKELVFSEMDKLESQASNCFTNFIGWKL